jgi:hypothetical protein
MGRKQARNGLSMCRPVSSRSVDVRAASLGGFWCLISNSAGCRMVSCISYPMFVGGCMVCSGSFVLKSYCLLVLCLYLIPNDCVYVCVVCSGDGSALNVSCISSKMVTCVIISCI